MAVMPRFLALIAGLCHTGVITTPKMYVSETWVKNTMKRVSGSNAYNTDADYHRLLSVSLLYTHYQAAFFKNCTMMIILV